LCNDQNQEEISKLENSKIKVVNVKKITSIYLLKPNLLFCPFSAPFYAHSAVPCVSVVYDLQHRTYPYFFSVNEIGHRENMLLNVSKKCDEVICISDYVKSTLLETKLMNERKINTVHIQLPKRLPSNLNEENNQKDLLNELGLISDKYFYYPANFWPHKNHMVLFTAFAMFKAESSGNQYKLVCSGSKNEQMDYYKDCVKIMGLENEIIFTGYLSDQEVMCLFKNCKLIVYPSLYEGFGMPIVEALFYKKLIVCSNKCSLPEVGGSAAIYFDPRKPQDLYNIFLKIINNSSLFIQCEKKLENQYLKFSSPEVMTTQYLTVFKRAIKNHSTLLVSSIYGVYLDGWAGENLLVEYARGYKPRRIKMSVFVPSFVSEEDIIFEIKNQDSQLLRKMEITKEKIQVFEIDIPLNQGSVTIRSSHSFCPKDNGSPDDRVLSFILQKCEIISFNNSLTLFPKQVET
jgi:glycosyltransferase involved in cell wall biosynthesis